MTSYPRVPGRRRIAAALVAALAGSSIAGCSGTSCDDLDALRAEREQRRAAYLALAASSASPEETGAADAELHAFERRVYDLENSCAQP